MEPLSALGLAANVVQFVDFTWRLISETRSIHKSADGAGEDVLLLDTILRDVEDLNNGLSSGVSSTGTLKELVSECIKIAAEIRKVVQTLKCDKRNSKWASFQVALRQVSSQGKIDSLTKNLGKIQSQIAQHLFLELW
jgi:hypothetical protein